ncbi:MAG: hypothetical protein NVS2B3_16480 [Vulcanimicrobiaceae bacterium]
MISTRIDTDHLRQNRDEIVWRIVTSGVLPEQRTLAVDIVADAFYDRLVEALERGQYLELVSWVDRICESYRAFPQIGSMLASACRAVIADLHGSECDTSPMVPELSALEHAICGVAFKPRARHVVSVAALDEIDVLIEDLVGRLEARDPLTGEHSLAVSAWCGRMGRRLSLSEAEVTYVTRCGRVHDVGKMQIPPEILQAPRSLSDAEWVVMRAHALAGEEIVRGIKPLRNLAAPVRSHHERLDGQGYPDRLVSSQIALATRIVSVADAFNAMIGRRPYRLPMSPGNALDQLVAERGKQFDPIVVEAMISIVGHTDAASAPDDL